MIIGYSNVTQKGQVTIPSVIRKYLGITEKERVAFIKKEDEIIIKPFKSITELSGSLHNPSAPPLETRRAKERFKNYLANRARK